MFLKPGDLIKVQARDSIVDEDLPMVMVEAVIGDETTVLACGDCAIISVEGYLFSLSDYDIVWINGRDLTSK